MGKKIFFVIAFLVLSVLFIKPVLAADIEIDHNAELSKICRPSHCIIPIPTLVDPQEDIIKIDENFYLTGLTWNNTKIDIYLDDQYQGPATVVEDDSGTANFYYLIKNHSLLEGTHEWKVIAWSENMRKRSYVSAENSFMIESYFKSPVLEKITKDIDGNNWIIGSAENNSIVNIYVDNVYQGQVQTNGNFNYNLGPLSPGLHTFYTVAQEIISDRTSKRSNILSEQVLESYIAEEVEEIDEIVEDLIIEPEVEEIEQIDSEEEVVDLEEDISSISEEGSPEEDISVQNEEIEGIVNITNSEDSNTEIGVIEEEESQDQLVVDSQKSESDKLDEEDEDSPSRAEESVITEELQPATPNQDDEELIREDLSVIEKQERNRKVGLWLLIILVIVVVFSTLFSGKKDKHALKSKELEKKDDASGHQGDLFNKD